MDQLVSFTSIIETRKQQRKNTFAVFIDFSKAYDRIDRNLLWGKLSRLGLYGKIMQALEQIYNNVECCVRINGALSNWFSIGSGLKQGCIISPILFLIYILTI